MFAFLKIDILEL